LEVKTKSSIAKKNARTDIIFPEEFGNQSICFLIGDEIAYFTADDRGIVNIKDKNLVKTMEKR
jgi:hypothetical protein